MQNDTNDKALATKNGVDSEIVDSNADTNGPIAKATLIVAPIAPMATSLSLPLRTSATYPPATDAEPDTMPVKHRDAKNIQYELERPDHNNPNAGPRISIKMMGLLPFLSDNMPHMMMLMN